MAREERTKPAEGGGARKAEAAPPAKPKKRNTLLIVVITLVAVVILGGGGFAAWHFLVAQQPAAKGAKGKAPATAATAEKPKPAIFVALETFTVNLQQENGEHYLQTTLTLKVTDSAVEQSIKQQMPEIRSRLLLLLSSKRPSELTSVEGKQTLANQIADEVNKVLNPGAAKAAAKGAEGATPAVAGPVASVLFTTFIIQ